jgi:hypothetical protein
MLNVCGRISEMHLPFRLLLVICLVAGLVGCSRAAENSPTSADKGTAELKGELLDAMRAKNAQKFVDHFFIEEGFNTPTVRETNLKQINALFTRETIEIVMEEIPAKDLAEIKAIQKAKPGTTPRYSLFPKKMLLIRQKATNGIAGRRFLIGEQNGRWHIVTMNGHTT